MDPSTLSLPKTKIHILSNLQGLQVKPRTKKIYFRQNSGQLQLWSQPLQKLLKVCFQIPVLVLEIVINLIKKIIKISLSQFTCTRKRTTQFQNVSVRLHKIKFKLKYTTRSMGSTYSFCYLFTTYPVHVYKGDLKLLIIDGVYRII